MKLLFCKSCHDVIRLIQDRERLCKCGKVGGRYIDEIRAEYWGGKKAIPLGFDNYSLASAIDHQPLSGEGQYFKAFVIPKACPTFKKKKGE